MSDISGRQDWTSKVKDQQAGHISAPGDETPVIPAWVTAGGWLYLAPAGLAIIWALAHIGHAVGHGAAWTLLAVVLGGTIALWWRGYGRRLEASETVREQERYQLHEMAKVDDMAGESFEKYCGVLLRSRGYRDVSITGGPGDDGADITATAPDGTLVAVQCKRRNGSVGPDVMRDLLGATVSGRHQGRAGILMTNAPVTRAARHRADSDGIQVVDRPVLQEWMLQARDEIEKRGHAPQAMVIIRPEGMRPAAQVLTGFLCCALTVMIFIAFPPAAPRASTVAAKQSSHAASSASEAVIKEFYAAINERDWPTVWQLWYHSQPGYGPGYREMISGYRLTARDVLTSVKATGDVVAVRVLAYETTGAVESFAFQYKVHHGKITWGRSHLVGTSYPRTSLPAGTPRPRNPA